VSGKILSIQDILQTQHDVDELLGNPQFSFTKSSYHKG